MKHFLFSLVMISAAVASGQVVQSGTPAQLEVANGRTLKVFLQKLEGDTLTFQPAKSTRDIPAPVDKITSLTFFPRYDAVAVEHSFSQGDYSDVIATLEPIMEPYQAYMSISNNLQSTFGMLVQSYLVNKEFEKVQRAGEIMMASSDPKMLVQGQIFAGMAVLSSTNGIPTAEKLRGEVASESAGLYLQACIERTKGNPRAAIKLVCDIIADHGNDMDWMPSSEFLSANLYLDMALTNSASATARQVSSIYAGSNIARDAEKFREALPADDEKAPEETAEPVEMEEAEKEEPVEAAAVEETAAENGQDGLTEE